MAIAPAPPNTPVNRGLRYGKYTIKATSRVIARSGRDYVHVRGYDKDMSIVARVERVTRAKAGNTNMLHSEVSVEFVWRPIEYDDGSIHLDYINSGKSVEIPWYHKYRE